MHLAISNLKPFLHLLYTSCPSNLLWYLHPMKHTPLYDAHKAHGARLVDFAGWEMPVNYGDGIQQEHLAVRTETGLFDVSHMGEVRVTGAESEAFLRFATLNDVGKLSQGRGQYSMLPNDRGGLIDDLYIYKEGENDFLVVCNAANRAAVVQHLHTLSESYDAKVLDESESWALLALQGPGSALLLTRHTDDDLSSLKKNRKMTTRIGQVSVELARTGYTGEDGFEIFCRPDDAVALWETLVGAGAKPCGLGARDTLRLEAGFPLYGHEFTANTNPLCSSYAWVVKDKPFFGREALWDARCERRLVGLRLDERGVARQGYALLKDDKQIGEVTSGTISPLTREGIALGWLDTAYAKPGQGIEVEIRGRSVPATVVEPPFHTD